MVYLPPNGFLSGSAAFTSGEPAPQFRRVKISSGVPLSSHGGFPGEDPGNVGHKVRGVLGPQGSGAR